MEELQEFCAHNGVRLELYNPNQIRCEVDGMVFRWEWQGKAPDSYQMVIDRLQDYFDNNQNYK